MSCRQSMIYSFDMGCLWNSDVDEVGWRGYMDIHFMSRPITGGIGERHWDADHIWFRNSGYHNRKECAEDAISSYYFCYIMLLQIFIWLHPKCPLVCLLNSHSLEYLSMTVDPKYVYTCTTSRSYQLLMVMAGQRAISRPSIFTFLMLMLKPKSW